ncbi:MAG: ImmA/IrrE family metallo-endopeptidase [Clostridiaceae bacterium]|nr:ImmA/IrrE family metallo-endopeptidase [Clostridiaceae bacterium]
MKKELITKAAHDLRAKYDERDPRRLCKLLGIGIADMAMGTEPRSIQALVVKSSRCYSIVLNSDLTTGQQYFVLFHEIGHVRLGHAAIAPCTCRDLFSSRQSAVMEIEANEFVAEYLMDTEDTLKALYSTDSFFEAASIMRVPPTIMDFKFRMLRYYNLIGREYGGRSVSSMESPAQAKSNCMQNLECGEDWKFAEYSDS